MSFIGGKRSIAYLDAYTKEQTDELLDPESVHSPLGTAATKNVATEAQALAGTAGVLPDAAGVHAAISAMVPITEIGKLVAVSGCLALEITE